MCLKDENNNSAILKEVWIKTWRTFICIVLVSLLSPADCFYKLLTDTPSLICASSPREALFPDWRWGAWGPGRLGNSVNKSLCLGTTPGQSDSVAPVFNMQFLEGRVRVVERLWVKHNGLLINCHLQQVTWLLCASVSTTVKEG